MKKFYQIALVINIFCLISCVYHYIVYDSLISFLVALYIATVIFRLVLEIKDPGFWNFLTDNKKMKTTTNCHECEYKRDIPGNAHISCAFPWTASTSEPPKAEKSQWYWFPYNFDPVWQLESCLEFKRKES